MKELLGSLFVFGVQGTSLTSEEARHFRETGAAGFILYKKNYVSPAQCRKLVSDIEDAAGRRLLFTLDHEGGRVIMFREGFTLFPDNAAFGRAGREEWVRRQGQIEAAELRSVGVDVTLGPVLDILTDNYGAGILWRSYGTEPEKVAALGRARIQALQEGGLSACAKHFPGKGHALQDAHLSLPTVGSTVEEMRRAHLVPFAAAVKAGVRCVMTSHPVYAKIDPVCATFSERIVKGLLREELGFKGVVVTDDLQMGAVLEVASVDEAAARAAMAGHDLLLVCHGMAGQKKAYDGLIQALRAGRLRESTLADAAERIAALRKTNAERFGPEPDAKTKAESQAFAREVAREAATIVASPAEPKARAARWKPAGSVLAVFPRLSDIAERVMIEPEMLPEEPFARALLARAGLEVGAEVAVVGMEPTEAELAALAERSRSRSVLVFCFDAHLYPGWKRVLEGLASGSGVLLLRDPFDREYLPPGVAAATAFGFRTFQLEAALEKLLASKPAPATA